MKPTQPDPSKSVYACPDGCGDTFETLADVEQHLQTYHHFYLCEARQIALRARRMLPHELEVTCRYCQVGIPRDDYARHLATVHWEVEAEAHRLAEEAGRA